MLATNKNNYQKKGIFGNLLDDGVRDWYDSLQIADKESYKKMSAACIKRYIAKQNNWQKAISLYQKKTKS